MENKIPGWSLIFAGKRFKADLIEQILNNNKISVQRINVMGDGFQMVAGNLLEEIKLYVIDEEAAEAEEFVSAYLNEESSGEGL